MTQGLRGLADACRNKVEPALDFCVYEARLLNMSRGRSYSSLPCPALFWFALLLIAGSAVRSALPAPAEADQLFSGSAIPRLRIEIPEKSMEILRAYVWDKSLNGQDRTNVLATVREGTKVYTNVSIHLKGGLGSYRPVDDKPALTLNFDRAAPGQKFHGLEKVHLNNSVQDPSYLSEKICREMFVAAGLPCPRAGHAIVRLNGQNLGLYVLVEGWDKHFLKRNFPGRQGILFDGGYGNEVTNRLEVNTATLTNDWSRLETLGRAAQEPDVAVRLAKLNEVLDVDRFLTFEAMEVMLAHWDGYSMNKNNFRVFDDRTTGRIIFLPHGMDQMFGVFRSTPTSTITPHMKSLVSRSVLEVPEGRERFLQRMSELLTNVFRVEALTNRIQVLAAQVRPALSDNLSALASFNRGAEQLAARITQRARSIAAQLSAPEEPLRFDQAGEAKLTSWKPQRDSGNPSFSSSPSSRPGARYLEIRASGSQAYGSWRTTALLEKGEYQFVGKVQTEGLRSGPGVTRPGVTLRKSGEREAKMVLEAPAWTELRYDFTMPAQADIELLCEFRGGSGRARWELDSLKLIRKATQLPVSQNPKPVATR